MSRSMTTARCSSSSILEGAQAGLSWETILKKRENYREAFDHFDPAIVAKYGKRKQQSLLSNPGIVRNRLKIEAAIQNAKAFLAVQEEFGTFDKYIWGFVGHKPKQNARKSTGRGARPHARIGRHEQGLEAARFQVCRQHHLLRLHAGGGHGERSPCRMFPARESKAAGEEEDGDKRSDGKEAADRLEEWQADRGKLVCLSPAMCRRLALHRNHE